MKYRIFWAYNETSWFLNEKKWFLSLLKTIFYIYFKNDCKYYEIKIYKK